MSITNPRIESILEKMTVTNHFYQSLYNTQAYIVTISTVIFAVYFVSDYFAVISQVYHQ